MKSWWIGSSMVLGGWICFHILALLKAFSKNPCDLGGWQERFPCDPGGWLFLPQKNGPPKNHTTRF